MRKHFYHATRIENKNNILTNGLLPQIGENAATINEQEPLVYLFNTKDNLNDALAQWFGDLFEEDDQLIILKIKLDLNDPNLCYNHGPSHYESTYSKAIPPDKIVEIYTEDTFATLFMDYDQRQTQYQERYGIIEASRKEHLMTYYANDSTTTYKVIVDLNQNKEIKRTAQKRFLKKGNINKYG